MHVPDGFLDAPTSVATAVLAAGALGVAGAGAARGAERAASARAASRSAWCCARWDSLSAWTERSD